MNTKIRWMLPALIIVAAIPVFITDPINEKQLTGLGNAFDEMYEDRLVAESYIYNYNDALYRARLLLMTDAGNTQAAAKLGAEIAALTEKYAGTRLTDDERIAFLSFVEEVEPLQKQLRGGIPALAADQLIATTDACIASLHQLSSIQLREGGAIRVESQKTLSASLLSLRADWISFILMLVAVVMLMRERIIKPAKVETVSLN